MINLPSYEQYLIESISNTDLENLHGQIPIVQILLSDNTITFQKMDGNFSDIEMQAIMKFAKDKNLPFQQQYYVGQVPDKNAAQMIYGLVNTQGFNPHHINIDKQTWYVDNRIQGQI